MNNPEAKEDVFIIDVQNEDLHFIDSNFQLSLDGEDYVSELYSLAQFHDAAYTQSYLTQLESASLLPSLHDLPLEAPTSHWAEGHSPSFQEVLTEFANTPDFDSFTRL